VVSSLDRAPGREVTRNARLFAAVLGALNDTEIAVFEAKYHYNFWRPITAIRNGDIDGNPNTERDANWQPLITTPIQPEYPCAHCMISSTIAAVIRADVGKGPMPTLSTVQQHPAWCYTPLEQHRRAGEGSFLGSHCIAACIIAIPPT